MKLIHDIIRERNELRKRIAELEAEIKILRSAVRSRQTVPTLSRGDNQREKAQ
jgi:hypothetical protein